MTQHKTKAHTQLTKHCDRFVVRRLERAPKGWQDISVGSRTVVNPVVVSGVSQGDHHLACCHVVLSVRADVAVFYLRELRTQGVVK